MYYLYVYNIIVVIDACTSIFDHVHCIWSKISIYTRRVRISSYRDDRGLVVVDTLSSCLQGVYLHDDSCCISCRYLYYLLPPSGHGATAWSPETCDRERRLRNTGRYKIFAFWAYMHIVCHIILYTHRYLICTPPQWHILNDVCRRWVYIAYKRASTCSKYKSQNTSAVAVLW